MSNFKKFILSVKNKVFFLEADPFSLKRQPWETHSMFTLPEYLLNIQWYHNYDRDLQHHWWFRNIIFISGNFAALQQIVYHNVSQNLCSIMQLFLTYLEMEIILGDNSSNCVSIDAFFLGYSLGLFRKFVGIPEWSSPLMKTIHISVRTVMAKRNRGEELLARSSECLTLYIQKSKLEEKDQYTTW